MLATVRLLKPYAWTSSSKLDFISTISDVSIAVSVPEPIAIPILASAKLGESLTPSPIKAIFLPEFLSDLTTSAFSSGMRLARTSSMPSWAATALAVVSLSPVSIIIREIPSWRSSSRDSLTPERISSAIP